MLLLFISFLVFICCCCSSFIDVLHSHFLFDIIPHPSVDYRQIFTTILYFQPSPSQNDLQHFHFQPFRYLLATSATGLSGHFYPQTFSTLRSFTNILTCVNQRFSGSRRYFLEVFRASYWWSSKHRPNQSVCLIHSNPQSNNQNDSVLNSTIYWHELLVVKF